MAVDAVELKRARRGSLRAATRVLSECYPCVYRMAYGLTGRDDVGRRVTTFVLKRGLRQLPLWREEGEPMRWCHHHCVLSARRTYIRKPEMAADTLVRGAKTDNAYYAAFIRALRALPFQQREAFILHHGERFDQRALAVAMDCSTEAAANHLREAGKSLQALAGDHFATFTAQLSQTYQALTPSEELVLTNVQWNVRRYIWPRRILRLLKLIVMAIVIAGAVLFVWKVYPLIEY